MYKIRKAIVADLEQLLNLIKNINEKEQRYLRYDQESVELEARFLKNIQEDHVVLFTLGDKIFGFLEYDIQAMSKIWVYSLYFEKEYRRTTYDLLIPTFVGMKKSYGLPIHFAVQKGNRPMELLIKFIRAEFVREFEDGRCEYVVEVT